MKYEVTAAGRKELDSPDTWAKKTNTVKLVTRLLKGKVDADSVTDKERGRLNRSVSLGFCKRIETPTAAKHNRNLSQESCLDKNSRLHSFEVSTTDLTNNREGVTNVR